MIHEFEFLVEKKEGYAESVIVFRLVGLRTKAPTRAVFCLVSFVLIIVHTLTLD